MSQTDPFLGAAVEIPAGRGVVRFIGATSFSAGKWVGIELPDAKGKNDGTVMGVTYFNCKPNHGVFVRPSQVKVIGKESPDTQRSPPILRPPGHQRTSSIGPPQVASLRSPPSSSRSASPAKPNGSTSVIPPGSLPSVSRPSRLTQGSPTKRLPALSLQPRKSFPRPLTGNDNTTPSSPSGLQIRNFESPAQHSLSASPSGQPPRASPPPQPRVPTSRRISSPPQPPSSFQNNSISTSSVTKPPDRPPSSLNNVIHVQDDQENQELRAKIRVLEAKRADDARHLRELETRLSEAESFVALRPKLQAKLNSQQTELIATRRELADSQQLSQLAEGRLLDIQEQLEMAMLDKEMAEERAGLAEGELAETSEKLAVVQVELGVLKEGSSDASSGGEAKMKDSLAYIQLEKHNERLKEALIRLRDLSQETEQEQRRRIAELEKDVTGVDDLQSQHDSTLIKLSNAETQIENLKLQLDDALGAEEMLVQLTERNLMLGEKIEEMRITIEDLEALKELNDELEENHVETEKAMQEDLDLKDAQIREHVRKVEVLEEACQDLEGTIGQFRDLVLQLQIELDTLRAQTQTAQHESAAAASQTAAMMSLNLRLQTSASKNQAKNIELEIKKLEARETKELLGIVQPYLPQLYVESDSEATNCYFFFQRLAYKTDLINSVVAQAHGLPESLNGPVSDILVGVCEMRGRLSGLSTLCKRFAAILRHCDAESFLNIGRIHPEIAPMEKRIDIHIDLLRRDEFREMECVSDVIKIQAQFEHLAETYFSGFEHDLGERELGYALSFDHDLDVFSASIGITKTSISAIMQDEDTELDMGNLDIEKELFEPLQKVLDQCSSTKALSKKISKRVEELLQGSTALKPHLVPQMKALSNLVPEIVNFGISLAQQVMPHLSDVRGSKAPFHLATVLSYVKKIAASTVAKDMKPGVSPWEAVGNSIAQLAQECGKLLPLVMEGENIIKVSGTAPWIVRVEEIKASTAVNIEAERKAAQLNDEMQGLMRSLKTKDQLIQESTVKIELMERRLETVKKQADTIVDLEGELSNARKQKRVYEEAMEQLQADLDVLEQDNAKLKAVANVPERQPSGNQPAESDNVPIEGSLETSYLLEQVDALRGTVRFLRTENSYLKGQDLLREVQALPPLPEPISRLPTPPLDPSSLSDSDDSDSDAPHTPSTLRSLATETKLLYRDVIQFSSSPRVVDLSAIGARRGDHNGKMWVPKKKTPAHQVWERKMEAERLSRRVRGLLDRTSILGGLCR